VIQDDEIAAIGAALALLNVPGELETPERASRWKLAAREPDLEIEDYRRVR